MIDLHTHTVESDGTLTPVELVTAASQMGLEALAITDHDTFAGYDQAASPAFQLGLDLVCGIELSTKFGGRSVHLLGYFLNNGPSEDFRNWIIGLQESRHLRNRGLIERLASQGVQITAEEVKQRGGTLPGRPHFASILVQKGYAGSIQQAFNDYLDESAASYVPREEPSFSEGVARITSSGGLACLPHPGRVSRQPEALEESVREMRGLGLRGIEVYHSDHSPSDQCFYESLARRFNLAVTGGSDFHGDAKPRVALGTGIDGKLNIPRAVLDTLRGDLTKD